MLQKYFLTKAIIRELRYSSGSLGSYSLHIFE